MNPDLIGWTTNRFMIDRQDDKESIQLMWAATNRPGVSLLRTDNLNKRFGGVVALDHVSIDFSEGTVTAIIGPNGAGKTTLFNVIAGFLQPDSGSVKLVRKSDDGFSKKPISETSVNLVGLPPHRIALLGVGTLFQDIRLFDKLTALENVAVGVQHQLGENPIQCLFRPKAVATMEKETREKARHYLEVVGLSEKAHLWAEQLSYGQQKLVAIARLLAGDAKFLLLDEPTSGIHPDMIDFLLSRIQYLAYEERRTIIMIEHNLDVVKRIGDQVYLMADGRVEVFGTPSEVLRDSTLQKVFSMV